MDLPARLMTDLDALKGEGHQIEAVQDGVRYYLIFRNYALPDQGYVPAVTDVMLMTDYQYPASRMDMFWTDPAVKLPSGAWPQNANQFEAYCGRNWQRWSWHYSVWDPARHSVRTHLQVVIDRLARCN